MFIRLGFLKPEIMLNFTALYRKTEKKKFV